MLGLTTLSTIATMPGQSVVVGVFSEAIRKDLDISLSEFSAAYMVATFCASLPLTLVGRWSDRAGTRRVTAVTAFLLGLSCMMIGVLTWLAQATGSAIVVIIALTTSFFLLRFLGQGALGLVSSHALAMWFERRLGFAEAIRHLGMPLAVAALPALTLLLISTTNWQTAYAVLGLGVWALVLPGVWLLFINRPEDINQSVDNDTADTQHHHKQPNAGNSREPIELDAPAVGEAGDATSNHHSTAPALAGHTLRQAIATPAYWIVTASMVLSAAVGTAFVFHAQPMMLDLGLSKADATAVVATLGIVSLVCTIPFGVLIDRVRPAVLMALTTVGLGAACVCYAAAPLAGDARVLGIPSLLLTVHSAYLLLGLSQAMLFLLASPVLARYFGRAHHGAIRGSVSTFMVIGTSVGPFAFAVARDAVGLGEAYRWSGLAAVALAALACALRPPRSLPKQTERRP